MSPPPRKPARPEPPPPAVPEHGVGVSTVDFDRLYTYLHGTIIQIPEPAPGEPPDLRGIGLLLARVQNQRHRLEPLSALIERRLAEHKRQIDIATEQLRLERAEAYDVAGSGRNAEARKGHVEQMTAVSSGTLACLKANKEMFEAARKVVRSQMDTLEYAKQTLNSLKQIALADAPGDNPQRSDDGWQRRER